MGRISLSYFVFLIFHLKKRAIIMKVVANAQGLYKGAKIT